MPKRKRDTFAQDGDRVQEMRKTGVEQQIEQAKKILHKALKTGKGFYRQKLGKKEVQAKGKGGDADQLARIRREILALKSLDLNQTTNVLLYKTLLKSDAIANSELLPEAVKGVPLRPEGTEEETTAFHNVVSGLYNLPAVRAPLNQIMTAMYLAMGIPAPASIPKAKRVRKDNDKQVRKAETEKSENTMLLERQRTPDDIEEEVDGGEPSWDGFESDDEIREQPSIGDGDESLDEEELARYDALLGASSDEESIDEHLPRSTMSLRDLSITPSPSASPEPEFEAASEVKTKKIKPAKSAEVPNKIGGSTFLPTLMGGYWSGSESEASELDDEDMKPQVRKNRPGQMARRAIAEKKFGARANHVKKGLGLKGQTPRENDDWDPKRGAKESGDRGRRNGNGRQRNFESVTGENAIAVQPRKKLVTKRDDSGPLHGSWEAAKKAKEALKNMSFQGKKVTFD